MTGAARKILCGAVLGLGAFALPAAAHAQQTSPFLDLIAKGKRALNDFDYATADTVFHQLLRQPLSRQRRIDVLQLLAATTYPDDEAHQNKDSAAVILRQVVALGARRFVVKDVSWPGLDSLYSSVVSAAPAAGAVSPDSLPDVLMLANDGYTPAEIVDRVTLNCYTFPFDELDTAVKRMRSQAGLSEGLKRTCSRLFVQSDPADATLTVGTRNFGPVPESGQLRWVQPATDVDVVVTKDQARAAKQVDFPAGKLMHVKLYLPKDTLAWPTIRTPEQIAQDLRLFDRWTPSTPKPVAPAKPHKMNAAAAGLLWGILGGAAGYAVGQFVPTMGCVSNYTVPQGETWKVRGQRYTSGQSVNLGAGSGCVMTIAGGSAGGMFLFSSIIKTARNRSANARYEEAAKTYPTLAREWEARERRMFAEKNSDVRQALATQQQKLTQTQAENSTIRARNARLPAPEIHMYDLSAADSLASGSRPPKN